ncbi:hypothetical protein D4764_01G0015790 [Takifugu flavidus]|uniref:Uncharacterized protein n=1 Tax=Takifugu flavidus TaxID=433684 RepID=A0A5C6PQ35_9TELE|nr:hypothetical protein D4764_01G0015790 [Takifugu flavidus]
MRKDPPKMASVKQNAYEAYFKLQAIKYAAENGNKITVPSHIYEAAAGKLCHHMRVDCRRMGYDTVFMYCSCPAEPTLNSRTRIKWPTAPMRIQRKSVSNVNTSSSQPRQPYNIQSLKELRADLIRPRGLATEEFFGYLGNFSPGDTRACPQVPRPCFLTGRRVGGIEEVLKTLDGGPEPFRSRPEVVLHGLTELFPCRVFASATAVAALRLACRYLSAASGVPQAMGSGIAATTGTNHLAVTAPVSRLNNGGTEHGPPRDMVKALLEVHKQQSGPARPPPPPPSEGEGRPELGSNQNCHPCPLPLTIDNSNVVESPTPLEKTGSRALAMCRGGESTGRGSHVASSGCAWRDSMSRGPATRRSPTCPAPRPGSRRGPR